MRVNLLLPMKRKRASRFTPRPMHNILQRLFYITLYPPSGKDLPVAGRGTASHGTRRPVTQRSGLKVDQIWLVLELSDDGSGFDVSGCGGPVISRWCWQIGDPA
jgi:hypothetical protein